MYVEIDSTDIIAFLKKSDFSNEFEIQAGSLKVPSSRRFTYNTILPSSAYGSFMVVLFRLTKINTSPSRTSYLILS